MAEQDAEWESFKLQIRLKWRELTDEDVDQIQSRFDSLPEIIAKRYAIGRDEARKQVDEWVQSVGQEIEMFGSPKREERGS